MTNLEKLEHIVYLVKRYENDIQMANEVYMAQISTYTMSALDTCEYPIIPVLDSIADTTMQRIEATIKGN